MFIFHSGMEWILAGGVVFIGIMAMLYHVARGQIGTLLASLSVWALVFTIHGGTIQGSMTATFAALLFDLVGMPILRLMVGRN